MRKTVTVVAATCLSFIICGCTTSPTDPGKTGGKASDQMLAEYSYVRRLTYRGASGSNGPITARVERIMMSDAKTFVETTISNSSRKSYELGNAAGSPARLKSDAGETLPGVDTGPGKTLEPGNTVVRFMMEGHLKGKPASLTLDVRGRPPVEERPVRHATEFPIVVMLGG